MQEHLRQIQRLTDYRASQKAAPPEPEPKPEKPDPKTAGLEQAASAFFEIGRIYRNLEE